MYKPVSQVAVCGVCGALVLWSAVPQRLAAQDENPEQKIQWSFEKPVRPSVPEAAGLKHGDRVRNPIDAFVLRKLQAQQLSPAPLADKHTLVRRAYFDLLGLPPTPAQVEQFVNDTSGEAWKHLIDALLKSKQYGERWGRHWLDVARYADSAGFEGDDSYPNAWRYRDYVVKSFNDDKPYDQFVQEQIAGDEIWPDNLDLDPKRVYRVAPNQEVHFEARVGTGFYGFPPRVSESALDARRRHYETLIDWVDTTGSAFMGLTLGCARCHDHKFDAVTQEDYFAMQAIFTSSIEVDVPIMTPMEVQGWSYIYPRIVAVHEAKSAYQVFQQRTSGRQLTDQERAEEKRLRDTIVQKVMELPTKNISVPNTVYDPLVQIPKVTVLGHERPELIKPVHFLDRGELYRRRHQVEPALPAALAQTTGRNKAVPGPFGSRRELALWLTQPDHPLTARVMVNRIWQWHFGQPIVATANDFGANGVAPTHPELLDWLATEFVARGWRIKEMHRLIMTSNTYQMTSRFATDKHQQIDPDNRLLWRMSRRRLEAEALWDSIHATAGTINLKMGGRPVVVPLADDEIAALREKWQWPITGDPAEYTRRGLYILVLRNFRFPMFDVYDAPLNSVSCPQRDVTTVAPQALWSLNSPSVYRQAMQLASRVVKEGGETPEAWIAKLWMIALARPIRDTEKREALELLDQLATAAATRQAAAGGTVETALPASLATLPAAQASALVKLCLAVYNLSEFAYLD